MLNPGASYINETIGFLINNGAPRFATDWLSTNLVFNRAGALPTMIFAPTDAALDRLVAASNRTWEEIIKLQPGIDILENHVSAKPTQKEWPLFISLNNHGFGRDESDLNALRPVTTKTFTLFNGKPFVVIVIDEIILHEDQLAKLKSSKLGYSTWQRQSTIRELNVISEIGLTDVGRDIFGLIIDQGVVGRDLLALCTGNSRVRELCDRDNQAMFRRLLHSEFNFDYDRGFAKESPRELYAKFHHSRIDVYLQDIGVSGVMGNWVFIENDQITPNVASAIEQQKEFRREGVSLPVDGWFADNAKIQYEKRSPLKTPPIRHVMHLFYVKNHPETATVVKISTSQNAKPTIDLMSNRWFADYFTGKTIASSPVFQNLNSFGGTPEGIIQSLMMARTVDLRARVVVDGVEETIVYLQLGVNKI